MQCAYKIYIDKVIKKFIHISILHACGIKTCEVCGSVQILERSHRLLQKNIPNTSRMLFKICNLTFKGKHVKPFDIISAVVGAITILKVNTIKNS